MSTTINGTDNSAAAPALVGSDTDTGVFFPAANTTAFSNGGTERMRIDSAGNVGVGTTNPNNYGGSFKTLQVTGGSTSYGGILRLTNSDSSRVGHVGVDSSTMFVNTATSTPITFGIADSEKMRIDTSGNVGIGTSSPVTLKSATTLQVNGNLKLGNANDRGLLSLGDTASTGANAGIWRGAAGAYGSAGNFLCLGGYDGITFTTGAADISAQTERMRIDSSGNLLVGTTSASTFAISSGVFLAPAGRLLATNSNDAPINGARLGTDGAICQWFKGTSFVGSISVTASSTSYNTTSDYRLKENIAPMTGALDVVSQLKPVTYNWKADGSEGQGFIAHELQAVVPDCVTGEKDAVNEDGSIKPQGIDTSFLVATLTAAIQELKAELDEAKAEIALLKAK